EGVKVNDNMRLGNLFSGLTLGINEKSTIEVCFNLDSNGILLVIAEEISTGRY
ncbi:heat shock cognate 70 kDa protein-like protein, partial [Tanacetum coccineum]